jgi:hypothetical protein
MNDPDTRVVEIDHYEYGLIINALNKMRNELVSTNKDTAFVNETILKVMDAPTKRQAKRLAQSRDMER